MAADRNSPRQLLGRLSERLSDRLGGIIDDVTLPDRARRALDDAEAALARGDVDGAIATARRLEAERPGLWRTQVLLGLAYEARGELDAAANALATAASARDVVPVRMALGRVAGGLGDHRTAREHFEEALELRPTDLERLQIYLALADLHELDGPSARAIPALRHAVRLASDDDALRVRLAVALRTDGDLDAALAAVEPALHREPPALEPTLLAAELHRDRGDEHDLLAAGKRYELALAVAPDDPRALVGMADVAVAEHRVADALPLLHHALASADPDAHAPIHRRIGDAYAGTGDAERALDAYQAAVHLAPDDVEAQRARAAAALDVHATDVALDAARAAVELAPDDRTARALLGRALLVAGDIDDARRTLAPLRAARMSAVELQALGELALHTGDAIEAIALLREAAVRGPRRERLQARVAEAYRQLAPDLPDPGDLANLSPARLAPFLEALAGAVASHPLLSDLVPETTALRQHLDTPLTVAVLGEFNAGKSTLINAFVGESMLAMGVLPTTSHVNVIRYGPRRVARWTRHDGAVEEIPFREAATLVKQEPESIARLEFCYPHPDLRSVHFWDTPGFNAPDDDHEDRAARALATADAIVWMLDVGQALTSSEYRRLAEVEGAEERLLVVVNKIDRLGGDEQARNEVLAHVEGHLQGRRAGVYAVSASVALEARRDPEQPDVDALNSSGFAALDQALREQFFERAGRLKSIEVARGLRRLLRETLRRAEGADTDVRSTMEQLGEHRRALTARAARWSTEVAAPSRAELDRAMQRLRARVGEEVVALSTPRPGLFGRRVLLPDDRALVANQTLDRIEALCGDALTPMREAADGIDELLIATFEDLAIRLGPPESRTVRRRLEAWLAETSALRRLLHERFVEQPLAVARARFHELSNEVLRQVVASAGRTESERESQLQRLLPTSSDDHGHRLAAWGEEYVAAGLRLCDHVTRDLDILALDLEHRILRPFRRVLETVSPLARAGIDPGEDDEPLPDSDE